MPSGTWLGRIRDKLVEDADVRLDGEYGADLIDGVKVLQSVLTMRAESRISDEKARPAVHIIASDTIDFAGAHAAQEALLHGAVQWVKEAPSDALGALSCAVYLVPSTLNRRGDALAPGAMPSAVWLILRRIRIAEEEKDLVMALECLAQLAQVRFATDAAQRQGPRRVLARSPLAPESGALHAARRDGRGTGRRVPRAPSHPRTRPGILGHGARAGPEKRVPHPFRAPRGDARPCAAHARAHAPRGAYA